MDIGTVIRELSGSQPSWIRPLMLCPITKCGVCAKTLLGGGSTRFSPKSALTPQMSGPPHLVQDLSDSTHISAKVTEITCEDKNAMMVVVPRLESQIRCMAQGTAIPHTRTSPFRLHRANHCLSSIFQWKASKYLPLNLLGLPFYDVYIFLVDSSPTDSPHISHHWAT